VTGVGRRRLARRPALPGSPGVEGGAAGFGALANVNAAPGWCWPLQSVPTGALVLTNVPDVEPLPSALTGALVLISDP
jgi:hypothetical protein